MPSVAVKVLGPQMLHAATTPARLIDRPAAGDDHGAGHGTIHRNWQVSP
ncbi:hypothetical protein [Streptomyces sp. NPDC002187]